MNVARLARRGACVSGWLLLGVLAGGVGADVPQVTAADVKTREVTFEKLLERVHAVATDPKANADLAGLDAWLEQVAGRIRKAADQQTPKVPLRLADVKNAGEAKQNRAAAYAANDALADYEARSHKDASGGAINYRLLRPKGYDPKAAGADAKAKYPVIFFLHGAGERGNDNAAQLKWGGAILATAAQAKQPCFVLAPQCPNGKQWVDAPWAKGSYSIDAVPQSDELRLALEALEKVLKEFPAADPDRVYVMGLSMGGYGSWDAALRHPERFAAAVPICGGGDPTKAERLKPVAVWAFHGDADTAVPVSGSRQMIEAMKKAKSPEEKVRYTEYPGLGHNSWSKAWEEPQLWEWLFQQKRPDKTGADPKPPAK